MTDIGSRHENRLPKLSWIKSQITVSDRNCYQLRQSDILSEQ
ncbi:hypothetical protein F6453_0031 [Marinobacter nauticus]|uniref:Uncharacterized protein n=1 Tax=Marinobacter nauticus TaxID=2743 RepID=A0A833JS75_MARNT|nr:hypothetical protein F6453_0031 [Marinobacter nauticus]